MLGLLIVDLLLFGSSNAASAPAYLLIVGLVALSLTIYQFTYGLLAVAELCGLTIKGRRHLALWLTGLAAGLAALQSIGQLSQRDIVVFLPLVGVAYVYSWYLARGRRQLAA
jgi:hypothetical protein